MSFYVKLLVLVIVGSFVTHYGITSLLLSTDHMPEKYSANRMNYDQAKRMEAALSTEEAERQLVTSLDEAEKESSRSSKSTNKTSSQRSASSNSRRTNPTNNRVDSRDIQLRADEEQQLQQAEQEDTTQLEALPSLTVALPRSEDQSDQPVVRQANQNRTTSEPTRSDSDVDMRASKKANTSVTKANKPDNHIERISLNKDKPRIKKAKKTVQALDIAFAPPDNATCVIPGSGLVRVGVHFREASFAIKGASLTNIDQLIKLHRKCNGGTLLVLQNAAGLENTDERIIQLRKDEIKYYLLQRRVPKADMIFPDNS